MCSQTRNSCAKAFDNRSRSKNLKPKKSRGGQFDPPPPSRLLGLNLFLITWLFIWQSIDTCSSVTGFYKKLEIEVSFPLICMDNTLPSIAIGKSLDNRIINQHCHSVVWNRNLCKIHIFERITVSSKARCFHFECFSTSLNPSITKLQNMAKTLYIAHANIYIHVWCRLSANIQLRNQLDLWISNRPLKISWFEGGKLQCCNEVSEVRPVVINGRGEGSKEKMAGN